MYRILILRNDRLDTKSAYLKAKKFFADKDINVTFFTKDIMEYTSVHEYLKKQGFNWRTGQPATISYLGLDDITKDNCRKYVKENEYDAVIFSWDFSDKIPTLLGTEVITSFHNWKPLYPTTEFLQIALEPYDLANDSVWLKITHEIMHSLVGTLQRKNIIVKDEMDTDFTENNNPYSLTGNYFRTLANIKPYIDKLYKTQGYKYFSELEVKKWGLTPEMWQMLDTARALSNTPYRITSGYRTPSQNALVGGASKSTHLERTGCDISCVTSAERYKILQGLLNAGFRRIGVYKAHLHADLGGVDYPQDIIWFNEKD